MQLFLTILINEYKASSLLCDQLNTRIVGYTKRKKTRVCTSNLHILTNSRSYFVFYMLIREYTFDKRPLNTCQHVVFSLEIADQPNNYSEFLISLRLIVRFLIESVQRCIIFSKEKKDYQTSFVIISGT